MPTLTYMYSHLDEAERTDVIVLAMMVLGSILFLVVSHIVNRKKDK